MPARLTLGKYCIEKPDDRPSLTWFVNSQSCPSTPKAALFSGASLRRLGSKLSMSSLSPKSRKGSPEKQGLTRLGGGHVTRSPLPLRVRRGSLKPLSIVTTAFHPLDFDTVSVMEAARDKTLLPLSLSSREFSTMAYEKPRPRAIVSDVPGDIPVTFNFTIFHSVINQDSFRSTTWRCLASKLSRSRRFLSRGRKSVTTTKRQSSLPAPSHNSHQQMPLSALCLTRLRRDRPALGLNEMRTMRESSLETSLPYSTSHHQPSANTRHSNLTHTHPQVMRH